MSLLREKLQVLIHKYKEQIDPLIASFNELQRSINRSPTEMEKYAYAWAQPFESKLSLLVNYHLRDLLFHSDTDKSVLRKEAEALILGLDSLRARAHARTMTYDDAMQEHRKALQAFVSKIE